MLAPPRHLSLLAAVAAVALGAVSAAVAVAQSPPAGVYILQPSSLPRLHVRHCDFQLFAVADYPGVAQDFNWTVVPGACIRACVHACMRACVRVCLRA